MVKDVVLDEIAAERVLDDFAGFEVDCCCCLEIVHPWGLGGKRQRWSKALEFAEALNERQEEDDVAIAVVAVVVVA